MTSISPGWGILVQVEQGFAGEVYQTLELECVFFNKYAIKGVKNSSNTAGTRLFPWANICQLAEKKQEQETVIFILL